MPLEERPEGKRSSYHGLRGRERGIAGVHVAEMDLALVGDRSPAEQTLVAIVQGHLEPAFSERKRRTATLQSAPQNADPHPDTPDLPRTVLYSRTADCLPAGAGSRCAVPAPRVQAIAFLKFSAALSQFTTFH